MWIMFHCKYTKLAIRNPVFNLQVRPYILFLRAASFQIQFILNSFYQILSRAKFFGMQHWALDLCQTCSNCNPRAIRHFILKLCLCWCNSPFTFSYVNDTMSKSYLTRFGWKQIHRSLLYGPELVLRKGRSQPRIMINK